MKFTCSQQQLSRAINTVSKAVTARTTIPILKGILIKVTKDGILSLSASDLDLSIEKKISVHVEEEGSVVVLSKLFGDIIRKLPNENIEIEKIEENNINIKCSSSEFTIVGLPPDEFPNIGEIESNYSILLSKDVFKEMIKKTDFTESVKRASLLAKEGKNNLIKLDIHENNMIITSKSEEGNVKENVIISNDGDNLEIGFNSKYLLDALKTINTEEIKIELNTSISPCLIKPIEGNEYEYLILPVRLTAVSYTHLTLPTKR